MSKTLYNRNNILNKKYYYNEEENDYKDIGEYEDVYDDQWGDEIYDYDNYDDYDDDDDNDDNYLD